MEKIIAEIKASNGFDLKGKEELIIIVEAWNSMGMSEQEIRHELKDYGI